jgi:hypothetical protein
MRFDGQGCWRLSQWDRVWHVRNNPFHRSHDLAGDHLQLRGHDELVMPLHPGHTSAPELLSAKGSDHSEFERADLAWTIEHRTF